MYNKIIIGLVIVLALLSFMLGCEGDKGPVGPQGETGTAACFACHSDTNTQIVAISAQWANSVHATGGNFERNSSPCSGCHTSEGFVAKLDTGDPGAPENPSAIGCFTCHEPHTNGNFNLRTSEAVDLDVGGTFDLGHGNLCANCHQSRTPSPEISPTGTTAITSSYWGPHHGPQSNVLGGTGAFVFTGETYTNSSHTTAVTDGCPTCHMADPYGVQAGGHTWNLEYEYHGHSTALTDGCTITGCHSSMDDFNHDGVQDSVQTLLDSLRSSLITAGVMDSTDHANVPSGDTLFVTADQGGALFNYLVILEDRSKGVHNTQYTYDALNASIDALD